MPERLLLRAAAAGPAPCWSALSARRALLVAGPERRWPYALLASVLLLLLLLAVGVLLVLLLIPSTTDQPRDSCERHRVDMKVAPLPPMPETDADMLRELFTYLTDPSSHACKRDLAIGAHAIHPAGSKDAMLWGARHACFDPEFSLADAQCLVYSIRRPEDSSFDKAAAAFGCETHAFGPETEPARPGAVRHHRETQTEPAAGRLDGWVKQLGHGRRTISYLALAGDTGAITRLLEAPPRALAGNVRQLGVRLDVRREMPSGRGGGGPDLPALRRLYAALLNLQRLGFFPFAYDFPDGLDAGEFRVPGLNAPVLRVLEVAWVKTTCL